jgi:tetratricopeptide (TPR) repeat protein
LEIENLVDLAEKLKEKSFYLQSLKLFKKALKRYEKICDTEGMLHCMISLGDIYRMIGKFDFASKSYSEAVHLAKKQRKPIWLTDARIGLGLSLRALGKWKEAIKLSRESRRTYAEKGDREGIAFSLWAEAGALRIKGRIREAIKMFKKSLEMYKTLENKQGVGYCLCGLGGTSRIAGRFSDSLKYYTIANKLFSHMRDKFGTAYSHCGIGNALRMITDYKSALTHFAKATKLYKKIGDIVSYSYTLWSIGITYKMMGNFGKARDSFIKAMLLFKRTKDPRGIIYCILGIGELDLLEGRKAHAVRQLRVALRESMKNDFAIERTHAQTIISCIGGKIDKSSYNRLGLKLKFQGLPFNIP